MLPDRIPRRRDQVLGFFYRLRGMMTLRGRRPTDSLILLATILVHVILAPLRFVLCIGSPHFDRAYPNSRWTKWLNLVDMLGSVVLADCVVRSGDSLFRLRRGTAQPPPVCVYSERAVMSIFQPREGEVVVDVGAYVGTYTIPASRLVGSTGKVIAVEPSLSNFDDLVFNLKLNRAENVVTLNVAAWSLETTLDLHLFQYSASDSLVFLPQCSSRASKVRARPLDAVLDELGIERVHWIKIDVEGAEVEVLKGLDKTISQSPGPKLLIEVHSSETEKECLSILKDRGYEVKWISYFHVFACAYGSNTE